MKKKNLNKLIREEPKHDWLSGLFLIWHITLVLVIGSVPDAFWCFLMPPLFWIGPVDRG